MFSVIHFCAIPLVSPRLDEITRGIWKTKKHSPLLPKYFRVLLLTITHSKREANIFHGMTNGWVGGRTDGRTDGQTDKQVGGGG